MGQAQNLQCEKWSSRDYLPSERFDAWQEALNGSHLKWRLDGPSESAFAAEIHLSRLQDLQLVRCLCQPCSGFRSKSEIASEIHAYYGLLLMLEGKEEVRVGNDSLLLEPGKILLWDSTAPIHFKLHSPVHKITVLLPQKRLHDALPGTRGVVGQSMEWHMGLGAVAAAQISALCTQAPQINQLYSKPAAENILELIAISLGCRQNDAPDPAGAELVARIKNFIESNLADPKLGPKSLAGHFRISLRYLHTLFGREGLSVSRWILRRRLEKCRRDLVIHAANKNITEVALAWGFNDGAHFSRVFKKQYGISPSLYRKRARSA